MRRALRRAGWALAAAGGIGIAAPAGAQTQAVRVVGPGGHVEQPGEVIVMTEGQARLEEGQVELGLLADPMLFSYGLGAHVQGASLELRGFVPTEAARDQALKVAREQTGLHVIDRLKLQPNLATRCSVEKPEVIQRAAKELLEDAIPVYGRGMDVKCDARGRVTVTGSVASSEDRVLVSRKLRQVNGCSCVANQLEVASAVPEARPAETTGAIVIPDAPPAPARPAVRKWEPAVPAVPARTVAAPSHKEIEPPAVSLPPVDMGPLARPPVPSVPPVPSHPVMLTAPKEIDPPTLAMPRVYPEPVAPPPAPAPAVNPLPEPLPEPPPVPKPALPRTIDVPPPPVKIESPPPVKVEAPAPRRQAPSIDKGRPYGSGAAGAPALDLPPVEHPKPPPVEQPKLPPVEQPKPPPVELPKLPPVEQPKPAPAFKLPEVVNVPAAPAPKPPPLPPVVPLPPRPTVTPLPKPPAVEKRDRGGSEESYVTEGTITLDDDPPPVKPVVVPKPPPAPATPLPLPLPPKPASRPASTISVNPPAVSVKVPSAPVKPVEGTMTLTPPPMPPSRPASDPVKLSAPPAKPPAPPAKPPAPPRPNVPLAVRLKERIQGACGPNYEVKVTSKGNNYLKLEVLGPLPGEDASIMRKIRPVLTAKEFSEVAVDVDVITPVK